ncbi:MAG: hypothetical protein O3A10_00410 [Chloroflexi bacterium]|nr:hypothetical protein [Chloroflexota bacterium]MDA1145419.1 hypothetical protein [Chloroflexota bacterium]
MTNDYPIGSELAFLRAYDDATLRRIETVSDAILERIFRTEDRHRAVLAAQLLTELAEAAQRLVAVCNALRDRSIPVGRALLKPLPTSEDWRTFAEAVFEAHPGDLARAMGLDETAIDSAAELASVTDLARHADIIRVHEGGPPIALLEPGDPPLLRLVGHDRGGERQEFTIVLSEPRVIALADATGHLVALARDFLLTHIELREESLAQHS